MACVMRFGIGGSDMKPTLILSGIAAILLGASGCATYYRALQTGPPYPEGYSEERLGENSWRVSFAGNSATSAIATFRLALLRCAELTEEGGFDAFAVNFVETTLRLDDEDMANLAVSTRRMDGGTNGIPASLLSPDSRASSSFFAPYVPSSWARGGWRLLPETVLFVTAFSSEEAAGSPNVLTVESFRPALRRAQPQAR